MTPRARRRISAFGALALALLIAQVGALAHGYTHLRGRTDPVGVGTTVGQICAECLSFTPLLAAVGAPEAATVFHPRRVAEALRIGIAFSLERRPSCAFRARAPPSLV